jgi:hypothetical protein
VEGVLGKGTSTGRVWRRMAGGRPGVDSLLACFKITLMSVTEILQELPRLSTKDLARVFRLVHDLEAKQRMSGRQLSGLAEKLPHTKDPKEAARLREEIGRGFYGTPS